MCPILGIKKIHGEFNYIQWWCFLACNLTSKWQTYKYETICNRGECQWVLSFLMLLHRWDYDYEIMHVLCPVSRFSLSFSSLLLDYFVEQVINSLICSFEWRRESTGTPIWETREIIIINDYFGLSFTTLY